MEDKIGIGDEVVVNSQSEGYAGLKGTIIKFSGHTAMMRGEDGEEHSFFMEKYDIVKKMEGGKDVKQFEVGDRVEVIGSDRVPSGRTGVIVHIAKSGRRGVNLSLHMGGHDCKGHCHQGHGWYFEIIHLRLIKSTKPKTTSMPDDEYFEKHKDELCESCEGEHGVNGSHPDSLCEGRFCDEMIDMHRHDNPNEKENNMKENNINKNVQAVFSNKSGEELLLVDKHYNQDMMERILMDTHKVAILKACKAAEAELLEATKKDK